MKNKILQKILFSAVALLFWLCIWELLAKIIDIELILPTPRKVFSSLIELIITAEFWKICLLSFLRILLGFAIGVTLGLLFAPLTHYSKIANAIISPFMTVLRATPVASFIMVLWIMIGSEAVPAVITVIMVAPIVWQNVSEGLKSISRELLEVCECFEVPRKKRLTILILPTLKNYIIPGIITSAGLGWKSGIAAEIIAYTKNSIGREILNAKYYFESPKMLAWTAVVIIFSLCFEALLKRLGRRFSR